MTCTPCQKRAEARRRALMEAAIQQNPAIAKSFTPNTINSYSDMPRTLPRHEGDTTNTLPREEIASPASTPSVWNEGYAAFMRSRGK